MSPSIHAISESQMEWSRWYNNSGVLLIKMNCFSWLEFQYGISGKIVLCVLLEEKAKTLLEIVYKKLLNNSIVKGTTICEKRERVRQMRLFNSRTSRTFGRLGHGRCAPRFVVAHGGSGAWPRTIGGVAHDGFHAFGGEPRSWRMEDSRRQSKRIDCKMRELMVTGVTFCFLDSWLFPFSQRRTDFLVKQISCWRSTATICSVGSSSCSRRDSS